MIEMPTWFFPGGAGPYSFTNKTISHGEPSPLATFRFAEPVFIDKQQNFRVEIDIPDSDVHKDDPANLRPAFYLGRAGWIPDPRRAVNRASATQEYHNHARRKTAPATNDRPAPNRSGAGLAAGRGNPVRLRRRLSHHRPARKRRAECDQHRARQPFCRGRRSVMASRKIADER